MAVSLKNAWLSSCPYQGVGFPLMSINSMTLNSANDKVAWLVDIWQADTLSKIQVFFSSRTGTPVQHKIGLQGIGSDGLPDGTWLGGGSPATVSFTPPADNSWNSTFRDFTLDNAYVVSAPRYVWAVLEPVGTPDGSNHTTWYIGSSQSGPASLLIPYSASQTDGGAWSRNASSPVCGITGSLSDYGCAAAVTTISAITTNGRRQTGRLVIPSGETWTVNGLRYCTNLVSSGGTYNVGIWDSANTEIVKVAHDTDVASGNNANRMIVLSLPETELDAGTYYLGPERNGSNVSLMYLTIALASTESAFPCGDVLGRWAEYDGSSWSEVTTQRALLDLRVKSIEVAGSGSTFIPQISIF